MYIDSVVVLSLIVVVVTCVIVTYIGYHAYKHIKADTLAFDRAMTNKNDQ